MNSPSANLFLAIQQQITTALSAIKHCDQDLGQLEFYPDSGLPAAMFPCVLIDISETRFDNMGENQQMAEGMIKLRLGFTPYSPSANVAKQTQKEAALAYYDIEYALHLALQGWSPGDAFGSLARVSAKTEKREDNIRVREIMYSIAYEDYSTSTLPGLAAATAVIEPQYD